MKNTDYAYEWIDPMKAFMVRINSSDIKCIVRCETIEDMYGVKNFEGVDKVKKVFEENKDFITDKCEYFLEKIKPNSDNEIIIDLEKLKH